MGPRRAASDLRARSARSPGLIGALSCEANVTARQETTSDIKATRWRDRRTLCKHGLHESVPTSATRNAGKTLTTGASQPDAA